MYELGAKGKPSRLRRMGEPVRRPQRTPAHPPLGRLERRGRGTHLRLHTHYIAHPAAAADLHAVLCGAARRP